jgi:hypothetical protein
LPLFAIGVVDTSCKFVAGIVDTGAPVSLIRNDPNVIFGGLGEMIHEKVLKQKIS